MIERSSSRRRPATQGPAATTLGPARETRAPATRGPAGPARFRWHRRPRDLPAPVPTGEIVVAAPPRVAQAAAQGWPLLLPLLSGAGSLPLLLGSPSSGRRWLLLGTAASLLLSTGAGLGLRLLARRSAERARRRERARYLDHLAAVEEQVARVAALQRRAARRSHPDLDALLRVAEGGERLWERSPPDHDFLEVRLGPGRVPLAAPVRLDLGHDPLAEHEPALLARARGLVDRSAWLDDLPVTLPLRRLGVVAVHGPPEASRALVRSILLSSAVFHGPRDLRIVGLSPPDGARVWDWLKWLPHVREDRSGSAPVAPRCLLAATTGQAADVLTRAVGPRLAAGAANGESPHVLVVVDGYTPPGALGRLPVLDTLLRSAAAAAVTVVCLLVRPGDEPSTTQTRVELDGRGGVMVTNLADATRAVRHAGADHASLPVSEAIARRLAPWWPDAPPNAGVEEVEPVHTRLLDVLPLPEPAGELSGVGFLRAPIGIASSGPVVLDLNEAAEGGMGPHGLLVGATGSGKSELLRTLVAGLALTHPPELLAMVLVDFKGGAAFAGLAGLPHTAGLITNLQSEPRMVERARAALQGEVERRQRLLRAAGDLDSIGRYQELHSTDPGLEPLPRLLIVVDEFGELLAAHPEFLDLFTAVGRTGRSLGIHLLLASQRLEAGRLRGLDSHLRYRICLRTFSQADSAAVLGTPDAYLLPSAPGHGILTVDSDPPQRFKGLLVSAAVDPTAPGDQAAPPVVLPFDPLVEPVSTGGEGRRNGGPRHPERGQSRAAPSNAGAGPRVAPSARGSDLDAVVAALTPRVGARPCTHRIWLPPLASAIPLDEVVRPGPPRSSDHHDWLHAAIGMVDRPFQQTQEPLVLDFSGRSGHLAIAGAPRTGKSTLLATLIAGFALTHRPDQVQFYCVDLGGGLLHELAGLPHVGAVLSARAPDEVRRLIRELRTVVTEREEAFRRLEIESMPAWHRWRGEARPPERDGDGDGHGDLDFSGDGDGYGEVFLVVDGWSRFRQELAELEPEIEALASGGLHHGVHLIVASNRWADFRLALRDNLGGRLELRLNDPIESEIDRAAATRLPDGVPGRGLTPAGEEFQTALPVLAAAQRRTAMRVHPASEAAAEQPDPTGRGRPAVTPGDISAQSIAEHAVRSPTGAAAPRLHPLPALIPLHALLTSTGGPSEPSAGTPSPSPRRPGRLLPVPVALHDHRLEVVRLDLAAAPHLLIFGDPGSGRTAALRCIATALMARHAADDLRLVVVDYRSTLSDLAAAAHCDAHVSTAAAATGAADRLRSALDQRRQHAAARPPSTAHRPTLQGPHHLLVVDDYDLVAAGRNPLDPVLDLVAHGRDVGLHVLLARPVSGSARGAFEPFYQRVRESGATGLILSGDPREGSLLGARTATHLPPGRAHLVTRNGRGGLVQLAWTPPNLAPATPAAGPP